jgi:hypothetical protein
MVRLFFSTAGQLQRLLLEVDFDIVAYSLHLTSHWWSFVNVGHRDPTGTMFDEAYVVRFEPNPWNGDFKCVKNNRDIIEFTKRQFDYKSVYMTVLVRSLTANNSLHEIIEELHDFLDNVNWVTFMTWFLVVLNYKAWDGTISSSSR